jgi:hypothetical protein
MLMYFLGVMTRVALAFSLRRNAQDLLCTDAQDDDICCLHGLRAVFSLVIYLIHRGVFGLFVPFVNRTELAQVLPSSYALTRRLFSSIFIISPPVLFSIV